MLTTVIFSGPLRREYRDFRIYPRMDRAYKKIAAEQYGEAEALLLEVISIDSSRTDAYEALINLYLKSEEYGKAERYLAKVSPKSSAAQNYYYAVTPKMIGGVNPLEKPAAFSFQTGYMKLQHSYLLIDRGYYRKAEATLLELNQNYPQYDQPDEALVHLYMQMEDTAKVIHYLSKLSENNPMRAYYALQVEQYEKSRGQDGKIIPEISANPEKTAEQIRYEKMNGVYTLMEQGKYREARSVLLEMDKRSPGNVQISEALLVVCAELGMADSAEMYAGLLPRSSKTRNQFYHNAAAREVQRENFEQAYIYMDSLEKSDGAVRQGELAYVARAQGYSFQKQGDIASAESSFRRALSHDETDVESRRALALLLLKEERFSEAKVVTRELDPSDAIHLSIAISEAALLRQGGLSDSALALLSGLDEAVEKSEGYYAEKGYNQRSIGLYDSAVVSFEKARELNSENYGYRREIAQTKAAAGKRGEASREYEKAIDEVPLYAKERGFSAEEEKSDLFRLQRTNHYLQKAWDFNFTTLLRLDEFHTPLMAISPLQYASYTGFLTLKRPFLRHR